MKNFRLFLVALALCSATVTVSATVTTFTVGDVTFRMLDVAPGAFMMGATEEQGDEAMFNENPAHQVILTKCFSLGETEVTQALWLAVMGNNPSEYSSRLGFPENLERPVEQVSWNDCQTFITKLNELTGQTFRLPTEAEWEFAARGGNMSLGNKYPGSNDWDEVAWCWDNAGGITQTVGTKAPNELGFYDMAGNVREWVNDFYDSSYPTGPQTDPTGPESGYFHVVRCGTWNSRPNQCRVSSRGGIPGGDKDWCTGLRVAMTVETHDHLVGDVTGDGSVDIADANAIINIMLGKAEYNAQADVTGDGRIDIADVNAVINIMLGK